VAQTPEIKVGPPPQVDPRYTDLTFAISDTFRRASRRLRDQARALQGRAKNAERPSAKTLDAVEPNERRPAVPRGGPTALEPTTSDDRCPTTPNGSDAVNGVCELNAMEAASGASGQPPAPSASRQAVAAEPTAAETEQSEPTFVEAADGDATPGETFNFRSPVIDAARAEAIGADIPSSEPQQPPLAGPATSDPSQPRVAETASVEPLAPKVDPEAALHDPPSAVTLADVANECAKANPRRPISPVRMPTMTPLCFLAAMGDFVRTAAALNLASTSWIEQLSHLLCRHL
jgi:hypothetical protein